MGGFGNILGSDSKSASDSRATTFSPQIDVSEEMQGIGGGGGSGGSGGGDKIVSLSNYGGDLKAAKGDIYFSPTDLGAIKSAIGLAETSMQSVTELAHSSVAAFDKAITEGAGSAGRSVVAEADAANMPLKYLLIGVVVIGAIFLFRR